MAAEDWVDFGYEEDREMSWGEGKTDNFVVFHDVKFKKSSGKAVLCEFTDGSERWVPFSQTPDGFAPEDDTEGDLEVTEWMANKWDEEGPAEKEHDVVVPDVVVLRESDKAIQIRSPRIEPVWIPKTQIRKHSPVLHDGDRGELIVSPWIAEQKELAGTAAPAPRANVGSQVAAQGKKPSKQERTTWGPKKAETRQLDLDQPLPDDDELPF